MCRPAEGRTCLTQDEPGAWKEKDLIPYFCQEAKAKQVLTVDQAIEQFNSILISALTNINFAEVSEKNRIHINTSTLVDSLFSLKLFKHHFSKKAS